MRFLKSIGFTREAHFREHDAANIGMCGVYWYDNLRGGQRQPKDKKARSHTTYMLAKIRTQLYVARQGFHRAWLRRVWGMTIGEGVRISRKANLDYTHPKGVHIGDYTIITPGVHIFTHDFVKRVHVSTYIGSNCFLGAGSIILPGVTVGDNCVIAAGTVVTQDVPSRSVVAGNPGKILKSNIKTARFGIMGNLQPHELAMFEDED